MWQTDDEGHYLQQSYLISYVMCLFTVGGLWSTYVDVPLADKIRKMSVI